MLRVRTAAYQWLFFAFCSFVSLAASAATFPGAGVGAIPDSTPAGINITFNASGFTQPLGSVSLSLAMTHTFVGDLDAVLTSPGGVAQLVIIGRSGEIRSGNMGASSNAGGTYTFSDKGGDWWGTIASLSSSSTIPSGTYRASTRGSNQTQHGGCGTSLDSVFGGLTAAQTNGTWTLNVADLQGADTGSVTAASLTLIAADDVLYHSTFDLSPHHCIYTLNDLTGSGRSSYTVVRNTGGGPSGTLTWFVQDNDGTTTGALSSFMLGLQSDFLINGDFDGDGIDDAAVYRSGPTGQFIIRRSSRPTPLLTIDLGTTGDDPTITGDYDGDGIFDATVYRAGPTSGAVSHTLFLPSSGGPVRDYITGENGAFPSGGVDYTGDGVADIEMQKNAGAGTASFRLFDGLTGSLVQTFIHGTPTDVIVVGNHSGDALFDTTVIHASGGNIVWSTHESGTNAVQPDVVFGASATDFPLGGDFDGDGIYDYAVWRPSLTPGASAFFIRKSTDIATPFSLPFGQNGDRVPAASRNH